MWFGLGFSIYSFTKLQTFLHGMHLECSNEKHPEFRVFLAVVHTRCGGGVLIHHYDVVNRIDAVSRASLAFYEIIVRRKPKLMSHC